MNTTKKLSLALSNFPKFTKEFKTFYDNFCTNTKTFLDTQKLKDRIVKLLETRDNLRKRDAELFAKQKEYKTLVKNIKNGEIKLESLIKDSMTPEENARTQEVNYDEIISNNSKEKQDIKHSKQIVENKIKEYQFELDALETEIENGLHHLKKDSLAFKNELQKDENKGILKSELAKKIRANRALAATITYLEATNSFLIKVKEMFEQLPEVLKADESVFICEKDGIYDSVILLNEERFVISINSQTESVHLAVIEEGIECTETIIGSGSNFHNIVWNQKIELSRFNSEEREWEQKDTVETFGEDLITQLYRQLIVFENLTPESKAIEELTKIAFNKGEDYDLNHRSLMEVY
ncbi:hypothetical protein [Priestia megaterium]|uniref:Uncharacterized protein n=1 Tax=Priestia megaterium TaxID=1404 RepID=A0A6M6E1Y3_PRIMG|nr:hypothetical protein [Priestia megaterium]QJX80810.1 hypothetical protein FDZ14_32490 [Priestia megaterium]